LLTSPSIFNLTLSRTSITIFIISIIATILADVYQYTIPTYLLALICLIYFETHHALLACKLCSTLLTVWCTFCTDSQFGHWECSRRTCNTGLTVKVWIFGAYWRALNLIEENFLWKTWSTFAASIRWGNWIWINTIKGRYWECYIRNIPIWTDTTPSCLN